MKHLLNGCIFECVATALAVIIAGFIIAQAWNHAAHLVIDNPHTMTLFEGAAIVLAIRVIASLTKTK